MEKKNSEKAFCFLDDCITTDSCEFSVLQREYLWPADTMLPNSPKISNVTKRVTNFISLSVMRKYDKSAALQISACWLSNGVLKRGFLHIYLTTSSTIRSFGLR